MSDVSGYLMVSAKASYRDVTCEPIPGSPPLFILFVGVRGKPGNEANEEHKLVSGILAAIDWCN